VLSQQRLLLLLLAVVVRLLQIALTSKASSQKVT
jgi:hypothetical protein